MAETVDIFLPFFSEFHSLPFLNAANSDAGDANVAIFVLSVYIFYL